jgi:hypothetical protein
MKSFLFRKASSKTWGLFHHELRLAVTRLTQDLALTARTGII